MPSESLKVNNYLKSQGVKLKVPEPLWNGPQSSDDEGGITFSLINRYLSCKERFRLKTIDGLKPFDSFDHKREYGNMWHTCEEYHAANKDWEEPLIQHANRLSEQYIHDQIQIQKWYDVCRVQFPIYLDFWHKHRDVFVNHTPLMQEQAFRIPYELPSGRTIYLRGKWDSVDMVGSGSQRVVYIQENKTKGEVDELQIQRQLKFDMQTMLYLVAFSAWQKCKCDEDDIVFEPQSLSGCSSLTDQLAATRPIAGVRYNVVRRPLSGGKGTIVRLKGSKGTKCTKCKGVGRLPIKSSQLTSIAPLCPKCQGACYTGGKPEETSEAYYKRLARYIKNEPDTYFFRWTVNVSKAEIELFQRTCLDSILENMVDDYEWWTSCFHEGTDVFDGMERKKYFPDHSPRHYRQPYGCTNMMNEGYTTDFDYALETGNTKGLTKANTLFPELNTV